MRDRPSFPCPRRRGEGQSAGGMQCSQDGSDRHRARVHRRTRLDDLARRIGSGLRGGRVRGLWVATVASLELARAGLHGHGAVLGSSRWVVHRPEPVGIRGCRGRHAARACRARRRGKALCVVGPPVKGRIESGAGARSVVVAAPGAPIFLSAAVESRTAIRKIDGEVLTLSVNALSVGRLMLGSGPVGLRHNRRDVVAGGPLIFTNY